MEPPIILPLAKFHETNIQYHEAANHIWLGRGALGIYSGIFCFLLGGKLRRDSSSFEWHPWHEGLSPESWWKLHEIPRRRSDLQEMSRPFETTGAACLGRAMGPTAFGEN